MALMYSLPSHRPTVSPTKNSLVYFISIVYTDHPVWRSHREEAKRGPPSGHRITRNGAAMVSLLLPYATTGLSRIAGRCLIGATPRGQPRTPVSCTVRRPFVGRPVPRQLMRNELCDLTTIVPATAYHRRSYAERYSRYMGSRIMRRASCTILSRIPGIPSGRFFPFGFGMYTLLTGCGSKVLAVSCSRSTSRLPSRFPLKILMVSLSIPAVSRPWLELTL